MMLTVKKKASMSRYFLVQKRSSYAVNPRGNSARRTADFTGMTGLLVRNFDSKTSPSAATNKNWKKVMMFPAPGSLLRSINQEVKRAAKESTHGSFT